LCTGEDEGSALFLTDADAVAVLSAGFRAPLTQGQAVEPGLNIGHNGDAGTKLVVSIPQKAPTISLIGNRKLLWSAP
jgi:hypothetical protein